MNINITILRINIYKVLINKPWPNISISLPEMIFAKCWQDIDKSLFCFDKNNFGVIFDR